MESGLSHSAPARRRSATGAFFTAPDSAAAGLARGLAWAWRLDHRDAEPDSSTVGFGTAAELAGLAELVSAGRIAGAVVTVAPDASTPAGLPAGRRVRGVAAFEGARAQDSFTVLETDAEPAVRSNLGTHAAVRGGILFLGFNPVEDWGRLSSFWAYEAIARFTESRMGAPLQMLPAIGCLRLDDVPGTGLHQLQDRANGDRRQQRKIRKLAGRLRRAGTVLNVAVVAQALEQGKRVPLEQVWPESVRRLSEGVRSGAFEPICHGLVHLDLEALGRGEVDHREFRSLDAAQARDHITRAMEWQSRHFGRPTSFVAPGWAYGPAGDTEGAAQGLVRWHRATPAPLLEDGRLCESLIGELLGLHRLDYSPLVRLAAVGIPPMIAMHGALLDGRLPNLKRNRDLISLARLMVKRDVTRLIALDDIRWVGASELIDQFEAHVRR